MRQKGQSEQYLGSGSVANLQNYTKKGLFDKKCYFFFPNCVLINYFFDMEKKKYYADAVALE